MLFDLIRVREKGWALPRHRLNMAGPVRGLLSVEEHQDQELNRTTRVARLLDAKTGRPMDAVLPLYDVALICVRKDYMSLTGIERHHDMLLQRNFDFAQTWLLQRIDDMDWDVSLAQS